MSTKTILIDDLDGTDAFRTTRFAFDGHTYEIDLSREHFDALKHGLQPWINAGREVSKYASSTSAGQAKEPRRSKQESDKIRTWGRDKGMDVPQFGKLPRAVLVAYEAAHARPVPTPPTPQ